MAPTLPPQLVFIMCCRSAFCTGLQVLLELGLVLGAAGIFRMDGGIVQELSPDLMFRNESADMWLSFHALF